MGKTKSQIYLHGAQSWQKIFALLKQNPFFCGHLHKFSHQGVRFLHLWIENGFRNIIRFANIRWSICKWLLVNIFERTFLQSPLFAVFTQGSIDLSSLFSNIMVENCSKDLKTKSLTVNESKWHTSTILQSVI